MENSRYRYVTLCCEVVFVDTWRKEQKTVSFHHSNSWKSSFWHKQSKHCTCLQCRFNAVRFSGACFYVWPAQCVVCETNPVKQLLLAPPDEKSRTQQFSTIQMLDSLHLGKNKASNAREVHVCRVGYSSPSCGFLMHISYKCVKQVSWNCWGAFVVTQWRELKTTLLERFWILLELLIIWKHYDLVIYNKQHIHIHCKVDFSV